MDAGKGRRGRAGAERRKDVRRSPWIGFALAALVAALGPGPAAARELAPSEDGLGGWSYLARRLAADGIDRRRLEATFADSRFPEFDGLEFSIAPREPRSIYRGFLHSSSVAGARRCVDEHGGELAAAERRYGVDAEVVAAILYVETRCGQNTGSYRILPRLARLAMANEPENLRRNQERLASRALDGDAEDAPGGDGDLDRQVRERAAYLEATFYKEVLGTFRVADRLGLDPLEIRGSGSGAFGLPQFLPSSYLAYGADGDGDGRVSLFDPADAASSCARYLEANGWRPDLPLSERRRVIWTYNHSPAYVDTVLALAARLDPERDEDDGVEVQTVSTRRGGPAHVAKKRSGHQRGHRAHAAHGTHRGGTTVARSSKGTKTAKSSKGAKTEKLARAETVTAATPRAPTKAKAKDHASSTTAGARKH